jgi:putative ABC transport system substrate-binding protein
MKRRDFIAVAGGAVVGLAPLLAQTARAQSSSRVRRIGVLMIIGEHDPEADKVLNAFRQGLRRFDWIEGQNLEVDYRWIPGDAARLQAAAAELAASQVDLLIAQGTPGTAAARQATNSIPIIFINLTDALGQGYVSSLSHPGGNITGWSLFELSIGGKWLDVLKTLSPETDRVALMFNPPTAPFSGLFFGAMEAAAQRMGIHPFNQPIQDIPDAERVLARLAGESRTGLIVLLDSFTLRNRDALIAIINKYRLPVIFADRYFAESGGLISYGVDRVDQFRQAATYINRIFKGASPGDLPVQLPTKFELVINLKTAKTLGLTVAPVLLALADEVIE